MSRILWVVVGMLVAFAAQAETLYVTDSLKIPLRRGKSVENKILEMVPSGTPVEVVTGDDDGYTRVRTPAGTDGWILSRYLMDGPAAAQRLEQTRARLTELEQENRRLQGLAAENASVSARAEQLAAELEQIKATAADTLRIERENKRLQETIDLKEAEVRGLHQQVSSLKERSRQRWFLIGAGVAFGGLLLGLILPRLRPRRRSEWGDLR